MTLLNVLVPVNELLPLNVLASPRSVEEATPEITPQTTLPFTTFKALDAAQLPVARKRLVVLAVVEKIVVVVAEVPVAFTKVKFCKVQNL